MEHTPAKTKPVQLSHGAFVRVRVALMEHLQDLQEELDALRDCGPYPGKFTRECEVRELIHDTENAQLQIGAWV